MSVNKVILMGHTGKAPDFREFDNGGCVATFSLATTKRGYTTKDGRQIPERTEWHNVVLQNGLAKVANQYVKKGDKLYIEGELRPGVMTMRKASNGMLPRSSQPIWQC